MSVPRILVEFRRPNGSKQTQLTNVRPFVGEFVTFGALEFKVKAITCRYETIDGKQDHVVVHLEATP